MIVETLLLFYFKAGFSSAFLFYEHYYILRCISGLYILNIWRCLKILDCHEVSQAVKPMSCYVCFLMILVLSGLGL